MGATMKSRSLGFTLLEICLAVAIAAVMIMLAVPTLSGVIERQKADQPFDLFDALVKKAQSLSVSERRTYVIGWERDRRGRQQIVLRPDGPGSGGDVAETISVGDRESYELILPAALVKAPPKVWTFWPTGTCEPATVIYKGPDTAWKAYYPALKAKPEVTGL